jgi:hypothetical protein
MFVAFTLWNLDVDYQENRKLIVADFNESLKNADSLERLISRLVDRGDADLLVHLLAVSLRADGGLTEGLAGTFAKQMETQPVRFLTLLIEQPAEVRSRTYHLVEMGSSDTERLKTFLAGVPKNSRVWLVAREMLEAISKS